VEPTRLRPLAFGEIIDTAIKVYMSRFQDLMRVVLVMVAPVQLLGVLVQISVPTDEIVSTDEFGNSTFDGAAFAGSMAAFFAVAILGGIASHLATASSLKIIADSYLGEQRTWRESLRFALDRFGSLLWLLILLFVLTALATLACIIPGIYFYVAWSVAVPALVMEDFRGMKALSRSRKLVEGFWWRALGLLLITGLLSSIIGGALGAVFVALFGAIGGSTLEYIGQGLGSIISAVITTPASAAVIAVLYFDLRVRKEGFDLELLARSVGVDVPAGFETPAWGADEPPTPPGGEGQPPFWPPPPGWRPPPSV
jgi:hypothetical protein